MRKAVMKKWVKALRSGKYKQGNMKLKDSENNFCCLGVLCDISKKGVWINDMEYEIGFNSSLGVLSVEIRDWSGMRSCNGELSKEYKTKEDDSSGTLVGLNDKGLSFKQIANIIEKNWEAL